MNIVGQRFHAGREALRVRLDEAVLVALAVPAVVKIDVLVARVTQTGGDERIGGLPDQLLVDIAAEVVPAVPAHRRRLRKSGRFLCLCGNGEEQGDKSERQGKSRH